MVFSSAFKKNIGYHVNDLQTATWQDWNRKLALMDDVWCPNDNTIKTVGRGKLVPHPCDLSKFNKAYPTIHSSTIDGTHIFYCIAELNNRKNLHDLLVAFHSEFDTNEPVSLILKVSHSQLKPNDVIKKVQDLENEVVSKSKKYRNKLGKQILVIAERLEEDVLCSLHSTAHTYIDTSHGEAFALPLFDAWAFGKRIITSTEASYPYLPCVEPGVRKYLSTPDMVYNYDAPFFDIGTSSDIWITHNISCIRHCMRESYKDWANGATIVKRNIEQYSYRAVGERMKYLLNE